jgi:hypothetical protein
MLFNCGRRNFSLGHCFLYGGSRCDRFELGSVPDQRLRVEIGRDIVKFEDDDVVVTGPVGGVHAALQLQRASREQNCSSVGACRLHTLELRGPVLRCKLPVLSAWSSPSADKLSRCARRSSGHVEEECCTANITSGGSMDAPTVNYEAMRTWTSPST